MSYADKVFGFKNGRDDGFIYFIESGVGGLIKIGYATDPVKRMNSFLTGNPNELNLLALIPGTLKDERALHRLFKEHQIVREWFAPHVDIWRLIEQHWVYDEDNGTRVHEVRGDYVYSKYLDA
jgi:hypothetical protein